MPNVAQKDRDLSFEAFRGLAMIAVVGMHALYLDNPIGNPSSLCFFQLLNFAVPAFLFMSGYWSSREPIESFLDYKNFLLKKLSRILVPYLFWSTALLGFSVIRSGEFDGYEIIYAFLTGGACIGYYFVILLAQFYIITPVLKYINRRFNGYGLILVLLFNLVVLFVLYLSRVFNVICRIPSTLPFYSWLIYYQIGLYVGVRRLELVAGTKSRIYILLAAAVFLLASSVESQIIFTKYNNLLFAVFPIKYSSFLYSVCIILGFLLSRDQFRRLPVLLSKIGHYSFGIYFIHAMVLGQVIRFFQKFDAIYSLQPLYQLTLVVVTLSICYIVIVAARKLLPGYINSKVLGF